MLLPSPQEVFALRLKQEDIQHGIVLHRLMYVKMQQERSSVFRPHSALTRVRHWIKKTPLLRSMEAINEQALRLLETVWKYNLQKVTPSVGPEQEYFLVDKQKYLQRKDLIFTGRTLFGAMPPKGQELDDHYFGTIRQRIASYMKDVNEELWKLGVQQRPSTMKLRRHSTNLLRSTQTGKHRRRPQPDHYGDFETGGRASRTAVSAS